MARRFLLGRAALWAASGLVIQGCASPGSPVMQTVSVETPGCLAAACELRNDRGIWQVLATPGTVTLMTSSAPLQVTCRADGGMPNSAGAPASASAVTGAGGAVGAAVGGAAVGASFGAAALTFIPVLGVIVLAGGIAAGAAAGQAVESHERALTYPMVISVPMSCPATGAAPNAVPAGPLGLQVRGLSRAQAREAGLGDRGAVLVSAVADHSRAAAAGLRAGDILLSANGQALDDAAMLEDRVLAAAPGSPLLLRVWRDGTVLALVLVRAEGRP